MRPGNENKHGHENKLRSVKRLPVVTNTNARWCYLVCIVFQRQKVKCAAMKKNESIYMTFIFHVQSNPRILVISSPPSPIHCKISHEFDLPL